MPGTGYDTVLPTAPFLTARFTWTTEMQGGATCEIQLSEDQVSTDWTPGFHRVVFRGDRDWAGEITRLERTGKPGDDKVGYTASGMGLQQRLDYRIVRHPLTVNDEVSVIVEALLSEAQDNQYNGGMGFVMGDVHGTTVSRLRGYCFGVNIGDSIKELAAIGRGFDWEVDADGRLNIWNDTRGDVQPYTLSETDVQDWEINLDTSELLTSVTAMGDPSDPYGPKHRLSRTAKADDYGRREVTIDTSVITNTETNPDWEQELYDAGRALLKVNGGGNLQLKITYLSDRGPWPLGAVWIQDEVGVDLPDYFGGPLFMRCTDVSVTLEAMPPRNAGVDPPIYFIEQSFDALVVDLAITDGDPDGDN